VLLKLIGLVIPLRADPRQEGLGLDVIEHGEEAYGSGEGAILVLPPQPARGRGAAPLGRPVGGEA
jgi:Amt family ammonium transporter